MNDWKEMSFFEAVCINPRVSFDSKDELPFIDMKSIDPSKKFCTWSQKRKLSGGARFEDGDTLFARITPCLENGKIALVRSLPGGKGFGSTEFHVLRGKEGITVSPFVYYLSRWKEVRDFAEVNLNGSSGRQRLPVESFNDLQINFPTIPEQTAIAEILSSLDDKIDLLHKQNETLEQLAETIFRQWFGEKEKDSWPIGRVEDLFILQRGFDLPIQKRIDGIYPIYTSSGMSGRHSEFKVKGPGVTTGRSGVLGNVYYIQEDFWPLNTSLFVKDFKNSSPLHAYFTLKTIDLNNFNAGSAVPTLNRNHVHDLSIEIPPIKLIHEFDKLIKPFFKKLNSNQTQINHLTTLRDTLLPKLMSGEIRVNLADV